MDRACLNCGEALKGRVDKVFCSPYCKSNFHYEQRKSVVSDFKKIDRQLRLNRRILARYNQGGKSFVREEKLLIEGFDPRFTTHSWSNSRGDTYLFCYDQGFLRKMDNGKQKFLLITYQSKYMGALPDM